MVFTATARRIRVRHTPARSLYHRWLLHGRLCLVEKPTKKHYSFEIKKEVVDRFLAGETRMDLAKECKLSSPQQVKDWVSKWRTGGDEALRPKPKGRLKGSARLVLLTEEDRLRRENEKLRAENAYLKNAGLEKPTSRLKTKAIVILTSEHRLDDLLEAAGLARSTYFYHQQRLDWPGLHAA